MRASELLRAARRGGSPGSLYSLRLFALLVCVKGAIAVDLVTNGGFELGPPGEIGAGWVHRGETTPAGHNLLDTSIRHAGARSQYLRHCDGASWDACGSIHQVSGYNTITPGRTYRISAWIRKQGGANPAGWFVLGVEWYNNDSVTWENKMPSTLPMNYDWTLVTYDVVAPMTGIRGAPNRIGVWLTRHTDADVWYDDISVIDVTSGAPEITRSPAALAHSGVSGRALTVQDTVTVRNTGGGTLTYIVTSGATWVSVTPSTGTSTGEIDVLLVSYDIAGLSAGEHAAELTIADEMASNSPQTISITLTLYIPGDFDHDDDVDQEDFGRFQSCLSGSGTIQPSEDCAAARLDNDEDVDQADFERFQNCMSGANMPARADCGIH